MIGSHKFLAAAAAVCVLGATPIALAAGGATATVSPARVKEGKSVELMVKGMKAKERVKAVEVAPFGQRRPALYPRAGSTGTLIVTVKAQIKGKHTWTFTGRQSHKTAKTSYVVR